MQIQSDCFEEAFCSDMNMVRQLSPFVLNLNACRSRLTSCVTSVESVPSFSAPREARNPDTLVYSAAINLQVVSSPTGSGKTVVLELALLRLLKRHISQTGTNPTQALSMPENHHLMCNDTTSILFTTSPHDAGS